MKILSTLVIALALLGGTTALRAQEMPKMPPPAKEHGWLQQFVGEWDADVEIFMEPGKPPMKTTSTESFRALGGYWVVGEGKSEMMGTPFASVLTLGYDADAKKYTGTWIDSMNGHLWTYDGSVDATGKILTLETDGPCPMKPGKMFRFKEVTEFKDKDHRIFTSSLKGEDGQWMTVVRVDSRRKK